MLQNTINHSGNKSRMHFCMALHNSLTGCYHWRKIERWAKSIYGRQIKESYSNSEHDLRSFVYPFHWHLRHFFLSLCCSAFFLWVNYEKLSVVSSALPLLDVNAWSFLFIRLTYTQSFAQLMLNATCNEKKNEHKISQRRKVRSTWV